MEEALSTEAAAASLGASVAPGRGSSLRVTLRPFELATVRVTVSPGGGGLEAGDGSVRVEGGKL